MDIWVVEDVNGHYMIRQVYADQETVQFLAGTRLLRGERIYFFAELTTEGVT